MYTVILIGDPYGLSAATQDFLSYADAAEFARTSVNTGEAYEAQVVNDEDDDVLFVDPIDA